MRWLSKHDPLPRKHDLILVASTKPLRWLSKRRPADRGGRIPRRKYQAPAMAFKTEPMAPKASINWSRKYQAPAMAFKTCPMCISTMSWLGRKYQAPAMAFKTLNSYHTETKKIFHQFPRTSLQRAKKIFPLEPIRLKTLVCRKSRTSPYSLAAAASRAALPMRNSKPNSGNFCIRFSASPGSR